MEMLAYDSDSDSDSDSIGTNQNEKVEVESLSNINGITGGIPAGSSLVEVQHQNECKTKRIRKRRWDNAPLVMPLPPPRISVSNGKDDKGDPYSSLIVFEKDYLTKKHERKTKSVKNQQECLSLNEKLTKMYETYYNSSHINAPTDYFPGKKLKSSFANHLKTQKSFSDPNLFSQIAKILNIAPDDAIGSNIHTSHWDPRKDFAPFEYVERLLQREEDNRMREISKQHEHDE